MQLVDLPVGAILTVPTPKGPVRLRLYRLYLAPHVAGQTRSSRARFAIAADPAIIVDRQEVHERRLANPETQ